jgi:hypothetical protein
MSWAPLASLTYGNQPRRNWRRLVLWLSIGAAAIVAVAVTAVGLFVWQILGEKRFNTGGQGAVIGQVVNGALVPNATGAAKLPWTLSSTTDGNVYVTVDATGQKWILFPTWRGKGANNFAYVYHTTPAAGPAPAQIQLNGPDIWGNGVSLDYQVDRTIDGHWYHVVWNLD